MYATISELQDDVEKKKMNGHPWKCRPVVHDKQDLSVGQRTNPPAPYFDVFSGYAYTRLWLKWKVRTMQDKTFDKKKAEAKNKAKAKAKSGEAKASSRRR